MLNIAEIRFDLTNIQSISDMRSPFDHHSSIGVGLYDGKWTDALGVQFLGAFMIEYEAFVTWLVVMVMAFLICTSKVIINDNLPTRLQ
jgi:hypothetical protein